MAVSKKPKPPVKTYLNLPGDLVDAADAIVARKSAAGGPKWSRTDVIVEALRRYVSQELPEKGEAS